MAESTRKPSKRDSAVKISLLAEHQKFGKKSDYFQPDLFHYVTEQTRQDSLPETTNQDVNVVGLDLNTSEIHTLFALQKIFSKSDYHGNVYSQDGQLVSEKLDGYNNPVGHVTEVPYFKFSRVEYLEACGLKKRLTSRNSYEYGGNESDIAIKTLVSLFTRDFHINYGSKLTKNGRVERKLLRVKEPLIYPYGQIWEGLSEQEYNDLRAGKTNPKLNAKLSHFIVRPSVILMMIQDYFALKPSDFHQQVATTLKHIAPGKNISKYIILLCEWVWLQGIMQRISRKHFTLSRTMESLAHHIRMGPYIKKRNWKKIRELIDLGLQISTKMGLITDYYIPEGNKNVVIEINFNEAMFPPSNSVTHQTSPISHLVEE